MVFVDRAAPIRFLRTAYDTADWIAVFLKTYRTGDVAQRVVRPDAVLDAEDVEQRRLLVGPATHDRPPDVLPENLARLGRQFN